jgi:acyl-homoserine lactone acylase PvdQ
MAFARKIPLVLLILVVPRIFGQDATRWKRHVANVEIIRDDWGIAHVYGKSDADTVFGAIYAQAEDDFHRIEVNYLTSLGRMAEAEGGSRIYQDLRMRLFIDPAALKLDFARSPRRLRTLMTAWADGLNYFLSKHPNVKPLVLTRFEPWMALSFTEGSIGGDIERTINPARLEAFYGKAPVTQRAGYSPLNDPEPSGSNGIAIAPKLTKNGNALLLINPHTSFFFRSELQMVSGEGLNAYGASTWGQFFIYQGFNDRVGWMHTSNNVDAVDEYMERIEEKDGQLFYRHGDRLRPVITKPITIRYRDGADFKTRTFNVHFTHHGPVVRSIENQWVSIQLMHRPVLALEQSYIRTKARSYADYLRAMDLKANSSNNTIYADADGTIAYFHGNFVPRRDTAFDYTKPVDGANPRTDWNGLHEVAETPKLLNPAVGWLYNTNNWPWSAAGADSPKATDFAPYFEQGRENARGIHAIRVLDGKRDFTLDTLLAAAYDSYLPWFEKTLPPLISAYDALPPDAPLKKSLGPSIEQLRKWDYRWAAESTATSIAVFWGESVRRAAPSSASRGSSFSEEYVVSQLPANELLRHLDLAVQRLQKDFGRTEVLWGDINRFQRVNGEIVQPFDDLKPSLPVAFTSGTWGSLASFGARPTATTKKWYGTSGNSFVAVVEFAKDGPRARAISAGGESGDPASAHFNDQAARYVGGNLREVYFDRATVERHAKRRYRP